MKSSSPSLPPAWWSHARFGLFIHWGVYSVPAGVYRGRRVAGASEWLMHSIEIPVADYKPFAEGFTACHYDPEEWVRLAKEAGMGYIVVGAKHHDGFCLFETRLTDWNAKDATPAARDVIRPLVDACRAAGMPLGFYYSHAQDWINGGATFAGNWDPAQERDFDDYLDNFAIPQIRELLTSYGPGVPSCLWWDTPARMSPERAARVDAVVQELAPGILQNDRLGGDFPGHFLTPEQRVPASRPSMAWETCMTTNESWGFCQFDEQWKPPGLLVRQLCEVVSQGGNYLLNIGPKPDGSIPAPTVHAFKEIGRWFLRNGEAIRGASAGPMPFRMPWGCTTSKENIIYLCIDTWPEDGRIFVPLATAPDSLRILSNAYVTATILPGATAEGFFLELPAVQPDPLVTVIALHYACAPQPGLMPERARPPVIPQPADGSLILRAADCEIIGDHLSLSCGEEPQLGCWSSLDSYPQWRVNFHQGGRYLLELLYALPKHRAGSHAEVAVGDRTVEFRINGTGGWEEYVRAPAAGVIEIQPGNEIPVRVLPKSMPLGAVMNLRAVFLTPTH